MQRNTDFLVESFQIEVCNMEKKCYKRDNHKKTIQNILFRVEKNQVIFLSDLF